jgi:hypothetical protein
MTAVLTGLGIGLAFWIVTIPTVMLLVKRGTTNDELNKKSLELLEERNQTDKELVAALYHIVNSIDNNTQRLSK